jgi:hypothetical protein
VRIVHVYAVDAIRIVEIRGGAKHQPIDDAEHRRIRADPESKREHDRPGEARLRAQSAERVADVVRHRLDERDKA